jgi:hypothetical protein
MLTRANPALDRPVILFQDVIEILHRAVLAIVGQIASSLESGNGGWITGMLVSIDNSRRWMVCSDQRFGEKALGSRGPWSSRRKTWCKCRPSRTVTLEYAGNGCVFLAPSEKGPMGAGRHRQKWSFWTTN